MKLRELIEGKSIPAEGNYTAIWDELAKAGFEQKDDDHRQARFVSVDVVDGLPVDIEYLYNPETGAWSFLAAKSGEPRRQITDGRGEDDLLRHLHRKHRLKASQL